MEYVHPSEICTLDFLVQKHRKEKKELQAKIQSLKKSASKGDKKKRKEVLEEIAKLEIDLDKKHAKEINDLNEVRSTELSTTDSESTAANDKMNYKNDDDEGDSENEKYSYQQKQPQRVSKAQKRRDRKAKEERQKQAEILVQEELNKTGPRMIEFQTIKKLLKSRGLQLHYIPSDGDCLYNAIKHQLEISGRVVYDISYLRNETSHYIYGNKDTLISYMTNPDTGNILTDAEFEKYCEAIHSTSAWGGQIEITALSHVLEVPIEVLQASGPPTIQGDKEYNGPPLVITYHRHMYSLGEHYNSTKAITNEDDDDDDENEDYIDFDRQIQLNQ